MTRHVEYCEDSSITEAWAVVTGSPGVVRESEVGALENNASKKLGDFVGQPSFVVVEKKQENEPVPPFWHKQLAWGNGRYLSRIGHRYLSVHFLKKGNEKYERYEDSLKPQIEEWLDAYKDTVSGRKEHYPVERIGFGYINLFKLPGKAFDLSRYFKISFGAGAQCTGNGIARLEINFAIAEPNVDVSIRVYPEAPGSETIVVATRVEAHKDVEGDCSFEDNERILMLIAEAKGFAKDVFFDLATDETHKIMGAKYASSAS